MQLHATSGAVGLTRQGMYLAILFLSVSCSGNIQLGEPRLGPSDPGYTESFLCEEPDKIQLGSTPARRLTNTEYDNTVRELFAWDIPPLPIQPPDAVLEGSFENDALALGPSDVRISRYEEAALALGRHAVTSAGARSRVLPCQSWDAGCGRQFVETFGKRAFRRPLGQEELSRWTGFFEAKQNEIDFDAAVELTIAAMLQAPQFLYRLETAETSTDADGHLELTQHELASRLSYLLWESMPDGALLAAADASELATAEQVEAQARRMLLDNRARAAVRNFHRQWLYVDRVLGEDKAPDLYPMWGAQARQSAREETLRFAENVFFDGGSVEDLLTSNAAYVDDTMAGLYGVAPPDQPWSRVELDPDERGGILSRVAFLGGNAHLANGSPPLRGVFVMERLLCETRPNPPANADLSVPRAEPGQGPITNRELYEQRTSPPECQGCHVRIDGFGFGFENYDAVGSFRTMDNGIPVDPAGFANGIGNDANYNDPIELQTLLGQSDTVRNCVAEQWFTYANGRPTQPVDTCQVEAIQTAFAQSDGNLMELLIAIVTRPEFRLRNDQAQE